MLLSFLQPKARTDEFEDESVTVNLFLFLNLNIRHIA